MKTNSSGSKVAHWHRLIIGLTLSALASLDLLAGGYCYQHRAVTLQHPTTTLPTWSGGVTGSWVAPSL